MEVEPKSKISVEFYRTTRRHTREDRNLYFDFFKFCATMHKAMCMSSKKYVGFEALSAVG
jgi:hypothetical protein